MAKTQHKRDNRLSLQCITRSHVPRFLQLLHESLPCKPVVHLDTHKNLLSTSYRSRGDFASLHCTFRSTSTEGRQVYLIIWKKCLDVDLLFVPVGSHPLQHTLSKSLRTTKTSNLLLLVARLIANLHHLP